MSKWNYDGCAIPPGTESSKQRKARRAREKNAARFGTQELKGYIHRLPCCTSGQSGVVAAHLDHAGMGGTDRDAHTDNLVPLIPALHDELDGPGKIPAFERKYRISLGGIARVVTLGFKNNWPPEEVRRRWKVYGGK